MKNPPLDWEQFYNDTWKPWKWDTDRGESIAKFCPYGEPGDTLWVRETFSHNGLSSMNGGQLFYKANEQYGKYTGIIWKPSIHMPRAAARIFLRITDIRIERLNDISEEDAIAEGIAIEDDGHMCWHYGYKDFRFILPEESFESLWESISGKDSWESNPWVWVISFEKINQASVDPLLLSQGDA